MLVGIDKDAIRKSTAVAVACPHRRAETRVKLPAMVTFSLMKGAMGRLLG